MGGVCTNRSQKTEGSGLDVTAELKRRKIDTHCHVWPGEEEEKCSQLLIEVGDLLGITEFWCSAPISRGFGSMEEVRQMNDAVLRAMERHSQHIRGMCFTVASYYDKALDEISRCLDAGMVGVKLYNQYKICDPVVWPVIELCTEHQVPILMHAGYITDPRARAEQPLISHGADFAVVSRRYPEAILIVAHIGGGGDWEWTLRALDDASPNVYVDISGSNLDDGQVEMAVDRLGAHRVLFATDGTMAGCVGKVAEASLTDEERDLVFWGNAQRLLALQGKSPLSTTDQKGVAS